MSCVKYFCDAHDLCQFLSRDWDKACCSQILYFFFSFQFPSVVFIFSLLDQLECWLNSVQSVIIWRVVYLKAKKQQQNIPLFQVVVHV